MVPQIDRAFFCALPGEVTVAGHAVRAGQVAWSDPVPRATGSVITLAIRDADQPSVVMACSGQPVAMGGPFVMNTKTEITQAFNDFHPGSSATSPARRA